MKQTMISFMKKPTTVIGILTAIMFQLIFSVVWMTAYDGVNDRIDNLKLAVVNEDPEFQVPIVEQLKKQLPVQVTGAQSLASAQEQLEDRELHMVLVIPKGFKEALGNLGQPAQLQYYINESNPAMIKSLTTSIADRITKQLNHYAVTESVQALLVNLELPQLPKEQAAPMAAGLSERITGKLTSNNPVEGMASQMVPMMLVLASYVGSMIMAMNLEQSSLMLGASVSKWGKFAARCLIHALSAILVSLVGSSLVIAFGGQHEQGFLSMWFFQTLFVIAFMFVAQLFMFWFGIRGMVFNILILSAQLVSSGAMVPRALLSDFYAGLSAVLPATYAVEGMMNILFGGPSAAQYILPLLLIIAAALGLGALGVLVKKEPVPAMGAQNGSPAAQ